MKKLRYTLFTLCTYIVLFSQSPQSINYQAIAWNANNTPRTNQTITVTFNIRALTTTGSIEFTETHTTATNEQGLFTLGIGSANQNGFKTIDWSKGPKFMQVIVDGLTAGTTQILSVPYALYAEKTNIQAGAGVSVSGNTITNTGDLDNTNEIQALTIAGNQLTLSKNGGTVLIPSSGSAGPTYSAGSGISISPTNIISADLKAGEGIAIVGNTISSTVAGGGTGTTYTAGKGISINGNTISNAGDGDTSTTNEIQQITLSGDKKTLTLSKNGGSVDLPTGGGAGTTYSAGTGIAIDGSNKITATSGVPAGSIMSYGGATAPNGWLLCDGATVSTSQYPELFAAIGINWGDGGSGSFNLPDLRGMFLRGRDSSPINNDPEKDKRISRNGSNDGNRVGSYQDDQFQGHFHNGSISFASSQPGTGAAAGAASRFEVPGVLDPVSDGKNDSPRTGKETRPKNVYVLYIIKY